MQSSRLPAECRLPPTIVRCCRRPLQGQRAASRTRRRRRRCRPPPPPPLLPPQCLTSVRQGERCGARSRHSDTRASRSSPSVSSGSSRPSSERPPSVLRASSERLSRVLPAQRPADTEEHCRDTMVMTKLLHDPFGSNIIMPPLKQSLLPCNT